MLQIAIVGLPNVGKSTLFNLLSGQKQADAQNFPFCTIEPNEAIVSVPDSRLEQLAKIVSPKKIVPATIKFVDIAGLVKGASKGEGLGNQFLSHIRECDAILHVSRFFENPNITHVDGDINPDRDKDTIQTELSLADLTSLENQIYKLQKKAKAQDKESTKLLQIAQQIKITLESGKLASETPLSDDDKILSHHFFLLTSKPFFFVANVSESQVTETFKIGDQKAITISAKFEEDILDLSDPDKAEFLQEAGIQISGLDQVIQTAFKLLNLISFFTAGEIEVKAWPLPKNSKAPKAAGTIHTDFEKKFIAADTVSVSDFVTCGGWSKCKDQGKIKTQGKEAEIKDGDVLIFKHG